MRLDGDVTELADLLNDTLTPDSHVISIVPPKGVHRSALVSVLALVLAACGAARGGMSRGAARGAAAFLRVLVGAAGRAIPCGAASDCSKGLLAGGQATDEDGVQGSTSDTGS